MAFQSTVFLQQGFGVPGDLYAADAPYRGQPFILNSASAAYNIIGATCYTKTNQTTAAAGGTGEFAGLLVNSKVYASYGTTGGGPLAPTMTLANNVQAELVTEGSFVVTLPAAAALGDLVVFNTTTGAISTITPGSPLGAGTAFAYAKVDYFTVTAAGLAVITLTPTLTIPVPEFLQSEQDNEEKN